MTALLAGLILLVGAAPVQAQNDTTLGADLDAILADPGLAGADVGLVVTTLDGEVVYQRASERRQQPASNAKLATSAAALEILGPDHTFTTTVATPARRTGPVLHGDLYLRGTGDPTMLAGDYDALAERVADSGVRLVTGRLAADDTWFDDVRLGVSWAWDDEPYYYNAQVSALTASPDTDYDAGSIIVRVAPGAAGGPAVVTTEPPTDYVRIVNEATTGAAGSDDTVSVDREHGGNTFTITGSIPADGSATTEWMAVWEPTDYAASLFRAALERHGVRVLGRTVRAATPADARVLASRESMPLRELQVPFLKLSNNLHAEILVKAIGRKVAGEGSWDAGRPAVADALAGLGVTGKLSLVDGSGLSRMDQISPDQLAQLLAGAVDRPWFADWYEALPIAGESERMVGGTLRSRMDGTAADGAVHAKTGSLTGVSGLSGYVDTAAGDRWIFSMVTNNTIGVNTKAIEDKVAIRLAEEGGETSRPGPKVSSHEVTVECSWEKAC
ncbi:D-alanyl-D-alanine carboxypeptidase/D-alanyl-D-alanine-endopeptidase [Actinophytocola sp. S1-96]|uniref:D-alanyl-D-alanine carboxypeptidase/D-alanyl-D-alanine-endopeptidase n=1 Tax=Actinophytocola gossypii TaxID=2812003 RepID=A0ABT2JBU0_9PSEU|nr:D-alanyl-D-alanine carboxypeptidase/D-alanyl-D-alanine-endopeptidase [Actinophytocola gossypii]